MTLTLAGAYAGGLLTLFAPCAALILPSFFAYAFTDRRALLGRTAIFTVGLVVALAPLGFLAGSLGALMRRHQTTLTLIIGVVVIVLGIWQALALPTPKWRKNTRPSTGETPALGAVTDIKLGAFASRSTDSTAATGGPSSVTNPPAVATQPAQVRASSSPIAIFSLGVGYGLAGVGCSGPILGAMLGLAGLGGSPIQGGILMMCYALGMATPIFVLAFLWEQVSRASWLTPKPVQVFGRWTTRGGIISGIVFVILGLVLIVTGGHTALPALISTDTQVQIEQWIGQVTASVPAPLFVALIAAIVALVWVWKRQQQH